MTTAPPPPAAGGHPAPRRRTVALTAALGAFGLTAGALVVAAVPAFAATTPPTYGVRATVPVGNYLSGIALDPSTQTGYVTDIAANRLRVLDLASRAVTASVPVGSEPYAVAVDPSTHTAYVPSFRGGRLTVIDGATNTVSGTVAIGQGAGTLAVDPASHTVYVADVYDGTVTVIDGTARTVTATVTVGGSPQGVAVDTSTGAVYVGNGGDDTHGSYVTRIDPTTLGTTDIPVQGSPYGLSVDPTTHTVYVANFEGGTVSVIAPDDTVSYIATGETESSTAVDPAAHAVFVTDYFARTVSVVDTATNTVTQTFAVGRDPNVVVADPTTHKAYVVNQPDHSVSVIDVVPAATTTTLVADNPSVVTGQPVTFTATVAPVDTDDPYVSGTPTGTVAFTTADGTAIAGCDAVAVATSGQAQCTASGGFPASAGSASVTASYSGDDDYATSASDALVLPVAKASTVITVTANPDPPVRGQVTTFTAAVAAVAPGAGTPTGTATFTVTSGSGQTVNCVGGNTVALAPDAQGNGSAQCVTPKNSLLGSRSYTVAVAYSGDADFEAQTGSLAQSVARAGTSVSVSLTPANPTTGTPVTVKAKVEVADPGSGHPNGTATFTVTGESGTQVVCQGGDTKSLTNQSQVSCVLPAGTLTAADSFYTVGVYYSGSRGFYPSYGQRSLKIGLGASTTTVTQPAASSPQGQPMTFTATVRPDKASTAALGGTVSFTVTDKTGAAVACAGGGTPAADGTQSCTVAGSDLIAANSPYTVTAVWSGDENYRGSQGKVVHRVTRR